MRHCKKALSLGLATALLLSLLCCGFPAVVTAQEAPVENPPAIPSDSIIPGPVEPQPPQTITDGDFKGILQGDRVYITNYTGTDTALVIPTTLGGYTVAGVHNVSAGLPWFQAKKEYITSLTIPDGIGILFISLFENLPNLQTLTLGNAITEITQGICIYSSKLTTINIAEDNPNYCDIDGVVYTKDKKTLVVYPLGQGSVYHVPDTAEDVDALLAIDSISITPIISENNPYFTTVDGITYNRKGQNVFFCSPEKSGAYVMPSEVTSITKGAFQNCDKLTSVTLSDNITGIAYAAFAGCTSLAHVDIPDSVEVIGDYAFADTALTSLSLSDNVGRIGSGAFERAPITTLSLGNGVEVICSAAFYDCNITELVFPKSLAYVENYAFGKNEMTAVDVPATITSFGDSVFTDCRELVQATFHAGVSEVPKETFANCERLSDVQLADTYSGINDSAFENCTSLKTITLPGALLYIGNLAFCNSGLLEIDLPPTVQDIGECAFAYTGLTDLPNAEEIHAINEFTYAGSALTQAHIPANITTICYGAFWGCGDLASVSIPDTVVSVCGHAFADTLFYDAQPEGPIYIDDVFYNYKGSYPTDAPLAIRYGTRVIADYAMDHEDEDDWDLPDLFDQSKLTHVIIPETAVTIGQSAFNRCPSLKTIFIPDTIKDFCYNSFRNHHPDFTILGYAGGCVEQYAAMMGIPFKALTDLADGLNEIEGVLYYCRNGKVDTAYVGTTTYQGKQYTVANGTVVTAGWMTDAYGTFYLDGNNNKVTSRWMPKDNNWCYLGADGYMVTNAWIMDSVGWCYLGADGYCVTNAWMADSIGWCYLDGDGRMVTNAWIMDSVGWCYLGADGYCVTNAWMADSIGWCYLDAGGRMVTNAWIMDSVGWCYLGADGYCVTNAWMADSIGWCYLDAGGRMVTNAWIMDSVGWCYLGADGYCVTNAWMADSIGWCYLDGDGRMIVGRTVFVDGGWYTFDQNGYWVA